MAERSDGYSGIILLAPCANGKRLQGKMTAERYWIGPKENIVMSVTLKAALEGTQFCNFFCFLKIENMLNVQL